MNTEISSSLPLLYSPQSNRQTNFFSFECYSFSASLPHHSYHLAGPMKGVLFALREKFRRIFAHKLWQLISGIINFSHYNNSISSNLHNNLGDFKNFPRLPPTKSQILSLALALHRPGQAGTGQLPHRPVGRRRAFQGLSQLQSSQLTERGTRVAGRGCCELLPPVL